MPPLARKRPAARRIAGALFDLGGDALALGVRVVTGRGARAPAAIDPPPGGQASDEETARRAAAAQAADARRAAAAEEAAARLDAARDRLRATIAPPDDDAQ